jgi:hypothetical protein
LAESARSLRWPHFKYAGYSQFGRLEIAPIALKNPSARVIQQAVNRNPSGDSSFADRTRLMCAPTSQMRVLVFKWQLTIAA